MKRVRPGTGVRAVSALAGLASVLALALLAPETSDAQADVVPALTVRSTNGRNLLEWVYPAGVTRVRIRYWTNPGWLTCVPPESESVGFADIPDQTGGAGGKGFYLHTSLANGTTYCYTMFAEVPPGSGTYSTSGRSIRGRPFVTGAVAWAFSMGTMAMSAPGLGAGILHAVSNDGHLYAMVKAGAIGAGSWPVSWRPYLATGPSQSRPASVPFSPSPPSAVVYLGSQAAAGNNAVGVDADTGLELWGQALGQPVQAGPAGMFTAYGGVIDAILLGTRDSGGPNAFHALDPSSLNPLGVPWPYRGETIPFLDEIGIVSSQAAVDYAAARVYFTSYQQAPGSSDSVWCLDLDTLSRCALWVPGVTAELGDVAASPTLRGDRVYVSPISGVDGEIEALDASDGRRVWGAPFAPLDGQIKQFILADLFGADLYFATTHTVWAIRDDGSSWALRWQRSDVPSPSQPVFFAGTGRVYAGGGDGKLYVLDASDGSDVVAPIPLGEPDSSAVGAPTVDQANGYVYVGTDAGVVYAVAIP
jgi:outer membrane protein assembly factor BamB